MTEILMSILAGHWTDVGSRLGKAIEACNKSVANVESRVPVSVRRLSDLKAAPEAVEIEAIEPVERAARAVELALVNAQGEDRIDNPTKDRL
ncbi:MAG: hypothetical protein HYU44_21355 [Betaproteobacteria bacterium]|nr:hypothetical protein [Betaproteobacteria bacterium]MBI2294392.1 hypothetical protein [Betaproteobacteria bacterium]